MDYCEAGDLYGKINSQRGILMQEPQVINNLQLISKSYIWAYYGLWESLLLLELELNGLRDCNLV